MKKLLTKFRAIMVIAIIALVGTAGALVAFSPTKATGDVPIEAALKVGNHTQGITDKKSVNARVDDVVNVTAWYHNIEDENSGRIAENVNIKINIPGSKTNTHQITSRISGTNTNAIDDLATVNTSIATNITYIPGTATRRFNSGTNENPNWVIQSIPDSVVTTGYTVSRLKPCWNFQETINIQVRVTAPVVSITKEVKVEGSSTWATNINAEPGDTLAYLITVKNEGNVWLNNVIVRDSFPTHLDYVSGSAKLYNSTYPNGRPLTDKLIGSGYNVGNYGPGANAQIRFNAKVPTTLKDCGDYRFTNVGVVRADQLGEFYNTAIVNTTKECKITEGVNIKVIKFHDLNKNKVEDSGEERLSGWRFNVLGPDGFNVSTVTDANGVATVTGNLKAGEYTVTEVLQSGWVNTTGLSIKREVTTERSTQTFVFGNKKVEKPVPPTVIPPGKTPVLPVTGPMEALAMTFGALGLSGSAVAWVRSKKRLSGSFRK